MSAGRPRFRTAFGLPLDAVGLVFLASTSGYFLASSTSGRWMAQWGAARLLVTSAVLSAAGLLGFALAPTWAMILLFSLLIGTGGGLLDGTLNIYFAANFGPRLMNWLHASFGIGATLGPLVMTAILRSGVSWRWGYSLAAVLNIVLIGLFGVSSSRWTRTSGAASAAEPRGAPAARETLRLPVVWLGVGLFLIYTGLEVSAGQWSFSLFTDSRHVPQEMAGLWVSLYWGSFTVGRILFGAIVAWVRPVALIRLCMTGVAGAAVLLGWRPLTHLDFLPLALFGFSLSPIFALMITRTQERLGPEHAPHAIGLQVAAAALGVGVLPGLAGVLASRLGLEVIPPFLLAATLLMLVMFEATHRQPIALRPAPAPLR